VSLRYAFSDTPEGSHGCRYVQDRILYHKADIVKSLEACARLAVCVPECAVSDVRQTLAGIAEEALFKKEGGFTGSAAAEDLLQGVWHNWEGH
jgi:cytochrome P450/NADPH-cytochrome P450 reductase